MVLGVWSDHSQNIDGCVVPPTLPSTTAPSAAPSAAAAAAAARSKQQQHPSSAASSSSSTSSHLICALLGQVQKYSEGIHAANSLFGLFCTEILLVIGKY
jgi:hypothetical protein